MSLSLAQTLTAVGPGVTSSFLATGGTGPYVYSVLPGGAGGTIDPSTGIYTAPGAVGTTPETSIDTIQVEDSLSAVATATIVVGNALLLFCDILQVSLGLSPGRVQLWDQKLFQPTDSGLYIRVSVPVAKPFASNSTTNPNGEGTVQSINMMATLDVNIISRDSSARDRKEEVVACLAGYYSQQQQVANSFLIGRLPPGSQFTDLSMIDGAAIPYRYKISLNMQYAMGFATATPYFDSFQTPQVVINP